jgi:ankyrin repeat protein
MTPSRPLTGHPHRIKTSPPLEILYHEQGPGEAGLCYGKWSENQWLKITKLVLATHYRSLSSARNPHGLPVLHAMLACHCPPEVLGVALTLYGAQCAGMRDIYGQLPLHYAVTSRYADSTLLSNLLHFFPQAASIRDSNRQLPLHQAARCWMVVVYTPF